jgi:hypothetical protein
MPSDFIRDDPANPAYQLPTCQTRNERLAVLLGPGAIWNQYCLTLITRYDQPNMFGWEANW